MKTTTLISLGTLIATCGFAVAQENEPNRNRPRREVPAEMLKKFDKDGDGKLNKEENTALRKERQEMNEKRRAEMMEKFDKDKDSKLSDEERAEMRKAMAAKRKELMEKYDKNTDGKLDDSERKAAVDAGEELPMDGPGRGGRGRGPRGGGGGDRPAPPASE